ncbi:MAG: DUF4097 family beta strand repeat-containing protein [Anaeroplasmataceae bacterium]|nr:DUF4097 family beta strand repeat-containing protein [Anaeroplasmataceae bacterium]
MEKFLEELRNALEEAKVENSEAIVEKYFEHFQLGHEAGMTDEEIIERFDSIEEIVESYMNQDKTVEGFKLDLDLSVFEKFDIVSTEGADVRLEIDEKALDYVNVEKTKTHLSLKIRGKANKFFKEKYHFHGTLWIGSKLVLNEVIINNIHADMSICSLRSENIFVKNINGDMEFDSLTGKEKIKIATVSGDLNIHSIDVPNLWIDSVNGDIKVDELCCDKVEFKTVNGDFKIGNSNEADFVVSTVNGDVEVKEGKVNVVVGSNVSGNISIEGEKISSNKISDVVKDAVSSAFKGWKF